MPKRSKNILKMVLIGDPGVGKTSLISQFVSKSFKHTYKVTIGLDVTSKLIKFPEKNQEVEIAINDIGGQKRFETLRQTFYNGTDLAMLVYDVTRVQTLENLVSVWNKELMTWNNNDRVIKIMVGNKIDLKELRTINEEEGDSMAKKIGCVQHITTSAKENTNVDEAFTTLARLYLNI